MRTILFGGSFDPPHKGHVALVRRALKLEDTARVLVIPTGRQPLKDADHAGAEHRLAMAKAAFGRLKGVTVSDVEVRRAGKSFMADTLKALLEAGELGDERPALLLGEDALADLPRWRNVELIAAHVDLLVAARAAARPQVPPEVARLWPAERVQVLPGRRSEVSSTELREKLARKEPLDDLVAPAVARYIASHGVYMAAQAQPLNAPPPRHVAAALKAIHDKQGGDTLALDLREVTDMTDYFVITTASNDRQARALLQHVEEVLRIEEGERPLHVEAGHTATWLLLDYGDLVVHIFSPEARAHYALDRLWGDAREVAAGHTP